MDPALYVLIAVAVIALVIGVAMLLRSRGRATPSLPESSVPSRMKDIEGRLGKSRAALGDSLRTVFRRSATDAEFWRGMEDALIGADVGVAAARSIVGQVRNARPADPDAARSLLTKEIRSVFEGQDRGLSLDGDPSIVLVVGVNGSGKTTSIAKLAGRLVAEGRRPLLAAADTFRAAAGAQLRTWADRVGVPVVGGKEGADPAAVAFDGLLAARARGNDVLIVDTAGRLHSKQGLMAELAKIRRVLEREGGKISESLLVLDATAGQNGIAQVREFAHAIGLTGIVLAKLDGTARGGIVVAVEQQLGVPVKLVGLGEGVDDLMPFDPHAFVEELLAES